MNQNFNNQFGRSQGFGQGGFGGAMMSQGLPNAGGQQQQQSFQNSFNQGYQQNQGFGQGVTQAQINRIHQNSLFQGGSGEEYDTPQAMRIHQASMMNGTMAQPQLNNSRGGAFGGGYAGASMGMLPNAGGQQQQQAFQNNFNQGFQQNQGFGQGVTQAQIERIHQNSLFQGGSGEEYDTPQAGRIHQASMMNGTMAQPQLNNSRGGAFGGGYAGASMGMGMLPNGGNQQQQQGYQNSFNQGLAQSFGGGFNPQEFNRQALESNNYAGGFAGGSMGMLPNAGGQQQQQAFQNSFNQGYQQNQAYGQGAMQAQIGRIHQNSLFQGASQLDSSEIARIQQATISGEEANPLSRSGFAGGFGSFQNMGGQQSFGQGMMAQGRGTAAFNSVMNADAFTNRAESGGPDSYPASMYTGRNQYDTVNQAVLNEMTNMNNLTRQF